MGGLDVLLPEIRACVICAAHLPLGPRPVLQVGEGEIEGSPQDAEAIAAWEAELRQAVA